MNNNIIIGALSFYGNIKGINVNGNNFRSRMRLRVSPVNKRDRNRLREIHGLEQLAQTQRVR
jgi:hypothetical protein